MANKIQETSITTDTVVPVTSRYADSTIIYYGDENRMTFYTYKRQEIPEDSEDKFAVITPGTQYRPDLVSQDFYGTVEFWWKIMEANFIWDIWDFTTGKTIRLPKQIY